jgi:hypothetical protein
LTHTRKFLAEKCPNASRFEPLELNADAGDDAPLRADLAEASPTPTTITDIN